MVLESTLFGNNFKRIHSHIPIKQNKSKKNLKIITNSGKNESKSDIFMGKEFLKIKC